MSLIRFPLRKINCNKTFISVYTRSFAEKSIQDHKETPLSVAGLSSKVLNVPNEEVGSGASKSGKYKNPEYFCYHQTSYFDAELEMLQYRIPQPSANKK